MGAARRAAAAGPEHPVPDAAARQQRRRLHDLSRQRRARVHQAQRRARHRRVPHLRLAELDRQHAAGDRGGPRATRSAICEAAICYTGDILDPARTKYSLELLRAAGEASWSRWARTSSASRTWPGCASRTRRTRWSRRCATRSTCRSTSTRTTRAASTPASILRAADAGVDIADAAIASMSGMTSQPCLNALVAALRHTERDTGLDQRGARRAQPLLGGRARAVLPVRGRPEGAGAGRVPARDAGRAVHEPPAAGAERSASKTAGRRSADAYADGQPAVRRHRQGDAVEQGGRRPGAVHGDQRPRPRTTC